MIFLFDSKNLIVRRSGMDIIDYMLIFAGLLFILNMFAMAIYCRLQKIIDKRNKIKSLKEIDSQITVVNHNTIKTILGKLYRAINRYAYGLMRYSTIIIGRIPSLFIRKIIFKYIFNMKISRGTVIQGGCEFRSPWNIEIGNSIIGNSCILDGRSGIYIGNNVVFGNGVHIWTEQHDVNSPYFAVTKRCRQPVIIKERSWICSDCTILPGIVVENGCVVASRSCVTKNCQSFSIYAGIPAKKISDRNKDLKYTIDKKSSWRFY